MTSVSQGENWVNACISAIVCNCSPSRGHAMLPCQRAWWLLFTAGMNWRLDSPEFAINPRFKKSSDPNQNRNCFLPVNIILRNLPLRSMRGFERQTHASWHRVNDNNDQDDSTAQCPWCRHEPRSETPRPQSSAYSKRPTKRPETTSTNRTDVISPAPARPAKHSVKQSDQKAEFGSHADADLNPGTAYDTEASPETTSQHTKYMGRTVTGSNGAFTTEPSRPRLPDAWTQDSEEPDTG